MKTMKHIVLITAMTAFALVSCDDVEKKDKKDVDAIVVVDENSANKSTTITKEDSDKENGIMQNEYADNVMINIDSLETISFEMENGTAISYQLSPRGVVRFDTWEDFNTTSLEMIEVERYKEKPNFERLITLGTIVRNLRNTTPDWLKTEEVLEDIADIEKEYNELMNEKDNSAEEVRENIEELIEKFDDLREELNETIQEYRRKNNR
jgi:hypothetical protein